MIALFIAVTLMYLIPVILVATIVVRFDAEPEWMALAVLPGVNLLLIVAMVIFAVALHNIRGDYEQR